MPLELQIIRASEFIRLGAQGHLDLAASREILSQLARACRLRGINQALLDLRDVRPGPVPMLTHNDLAALVNAFCEMGFRDNLRLALLYHADPHRRARLFSFLTTLRGWKVKASDDFEEALLWLSQEERAEGRTEAGEQEIPVRRPKGRRQAGEQKTSLAVTQAHEETCKANEAPPPDRHRPPSAASTRDFTKRKPKAGRS